MSSFDSITAQLAGATRTQRIQRVERGATRLALDLSDAEIELDVVHAEQALAESELGVLFALERPDAHFRGFVPSAEPDVSAGELAFAVGVRHLFDSAVVCHHRR